MNSLILSIILFISTNAWSVCTDFSKNSNYCLHDTTLNWPTYSNGDNFEIGNGVCTPYNNGEYQEVISSTIQGINISLQFPQKVCRNISHIELTRLSDVIKVKRINSNCCRIATACSGCSRGYVNDNYAECMIGISYGQCQYYGDSTVYFNAHITTYSDTMQIVSDFSKDPKHIIKQSSNAFLNGDTIELYRNDGSLRYKGFVNVVDSLVITKGQCYNKLGSKPIKKTNNADFCK
jgi:hypothetical protein